MAKPYRTSDDLISDIKRKISFPISQVTFTEDDLLQFLNEEMMISQVPSVLSYHEEYYSTTIAIPLVENQSKYPIPTRAIGMKLRDVFWQDQNGNLFDMTRISSDDRAFFQQSSGANQSIHKYYLQGNDVVLTPLPTGTPTGSMYFVFYIRPNQLVSNDRASTITAFCSKLTVVNASVIAGDTVSIGGETFTAVAGAPGTDEFQIGGTSTITATNLVSAINTNGVVTASNGTPSTSLVEASFSDIDFVFTTSNSSGFSISTNKCVKVDTVPDHIDDGTLIDFLETTGGHKIIDYDIATSAVSDDSIEFDPDDFPATLVVGDYICSAHECIIPFLPDDLHTALSERTCTRILAALGDKEGLAVTMAKVGEIDQSQGTLLDNRVEGSPQKIIARHSLIRMGKMGSNRRW